MRGTGCRSTKISETLADTASGLKRRPDRRARQKYLKVCESSPGIVISSQTAWIPRTARSLRAPTDAALPIPHAPRHGRHHRVPRATVWRRLRGSPLARHLGRPRQAPDLSRTTLPSRLSAVEDDSSLHRHRASLKSLYRLCLRLDIKDKPDRGSVAQEIGIGLVPGRRPSCLHMRMDRPVGMTSEVAVSDMACPEAAVRSACMSSRSTKTAKAPKASAKAAARLTARDKAGKTTLPSPTRIAPRRSAALLTRTLLVWLIGLLLGSLSATAADGPPPDTSSEPSPGPMRKPERPSELPPPPPPSRFDPGIQHEPETLPNTPSVVPAPNVDPGMSINPESAMPGTAGKPVPSPNEQRERGQR